MIVYCNTILNKPVKEKEQKCQNQYNGTLGVKQTCQQNVGLVGRAILLITVYS